MMRLTIPDRTMPMYKLRLTALPDEVLVESFDRPGNTKIFVDPTFIPVLISWLQSLIKKPTKRKPRKKASK
jgi:hypothetical protein